MARHDRSYSHAWSDKADATPSIDVLIGPGLRCAFPLPAEGHANDERFRRLLDALAERYPSPSCEAPLRPARD